MAAVGLGTPAVKVKNIRAVHDEVQLYWKYAVCTHVFINSLFDGWTCLSYMPLIYHPTQVGAILKDTELLLCYTTLDKYNPPAIGRPNVN